MSYLVLLTKGEPDLWDPDVKCFRDRKPWLHFEFLHMVFKAMCHRNPASSWSLLTPLLHTLLPPRASPSETLMQHAGSPLSQALAHAGHYFWNVLYYCPCPSTWTFPEPLVSVTIFYPLVRIDQPLSRTPNEHLSKILYHLVAFTKIMSPSSSTSKAGTFPYSSLCLWP